jgi:hypothetical protein
MEKNKKELEFNSDKECLFINNSIINQQSNIGKRMEVKDEDKVEL